jgi:hypothetical protein
MCFTREQILISGNFQSRPGDTDFFLPFHTYQSQLPTLEKSKVQL